MDYDLEALHPDHRESFATVAALAPGADLTVLYDLYAELNKIPPEQWGDYHPQEDQP